MLPYLVMFVMSNAGNMGGEWLIGRGAPVAAARKTVNSVGGSQGCPTSATPMHALFSLACQKLFLPMQDR